MKIEIDFPEQCLAEDKDFVRYFEALQGMANRMAMSHFKYGVMAKNVAKGCDDMKGGRERLWMYDGVGEPSTRGKEGNTGNTENLLDAANFFVIEYLFPRHPDPHFKAQTTEESPGLYFQEQEDAKDTLRNLLIK
jgi:hypothetical protein